MKTQPIQRFSAARVRKHMENNLASLGLANWTVADVSWTSERWTPDPQAERPVSYRTCRVILTHPDGRTRTHGLTVSTTGSITMTY